MSSIYGQWKFEMSYGTMSTTTIQTLREDGTYETHMIYLMQGGEQHIYHYGLIDVSESSLRLNFKSGKTEKKGCTDESNNFELRDFDDAEISEANMLLNQDIPYEVDGDKLTTTVKAPTGAMKVVYTRI